MIASRRLIAIAFSWLIAVAVDSGGVRADVVAARGSRPLVNTQILRLDDGRLVCRADDGAEASFPITQVEYLQITGWQMFNLAEKQRRAEDWRRAAVSYEQALADLQIAATAQGQNAASKAGEDRDGTADRLDRALLLKSRLIAAWDAQARFDRAVELYLDVLEAMPSVLESLRPQRLPETGSAVLEMAARRVDGVIAHHGDDTVARSLRQWRDSWPVRPSASAPSPAEAPIAPQVDDGWRQQIKEVSDLVQGGRREEALQRLEQLHKSLAGDRRAEVFYWQGRAWEAGAKDDAATPRRGDAAIENGNSEQDVSLARAGLAYMRVVIHFPRHPLAAECLYRAGALCRRSAMPEQATALWSELMTAYPQARSASGEVWADKAREELER